MKPYSTKLYVIHDTICDMKPLDNISGGCFHPLYPILPKNVGEKVRC